MLPLFGVPVYLGACSIVTSTDIVGELQGGGYSRAPVSLSFDPLTGNVYMLGGATFGPATATWAAISDLCLFDQPGTLTGNPLLFWPQQVAPIAAGQSWSIGQGGSPFMTLAPGIKTTQPFQVSVTAVPPGNKAVYGGKLFGTIISSGVSVTVGGSVALQYD